MKVQILKNIKYKGDARKIGDVVDVDRKDIETFIEKGIVDESTISITPDFDEMTKDEIGAYLESKGIKYNRQDNKRRLIDLAG